jgi:hypothetical protein
MGSLDGERMEMPEMEPPRHPTLVPPSPYSIAPLGFDVRPSPAAVAAKKSLIVGAFTGGSLFGGLIVAAVIAAWSAAHPPTESLAAAMAAHPCIVTAAAAPAPAAAPGVTAAAVAGQGTDSASLPGASAPGTTAAPVAGNDGTAASSPSAPATAEAAGSPKKGNKVTPHRYVTHKAAGTPQAKPASGLSASSNDDAFMKAIRSSSGH